MTVCSGCGMTSSNVVTPTVGHSKSKLFPSGDVQVLNVAVIGYCTRAEVELLKVKGLQYDPDEVILVFVENDFDNFNRQAHGIGGVAERPDSCSTKAHPPQTGCRTTGTR